jgi:hypothetical protein
MSEIKLTHDELSEKNVTGPLIAQFLALDKVVLKTESDIRKMAKTLKDTVSNMPVNNLASLKKLSGAEQKSKILGAGAQDMTKLRKQIEADLNETLKKQAQQIKDLTSQLDKLNEKKKTAAKLSAQEKVDLAERTRLEKEEAKINSELLGVYDKAVAKLNMMKRVYKDLVVAGKQNEKHAVEWKKDLDELQKKVTTANRSVGDFRDNVGNYEGALAKFLPHFGRFTDMFREAKEKVKLASEAMEKWAEANKNAGGATGKFAGIVGKLGGSLGAVTGVAAIAVVAIAGMYEALKKTERGADFLDQKITILKTNFDIMAINLGSKLADALELVSDDTTTFGEKLSKIFSASNLKAYAKNIGLFMINPILSIRSAYNSLKPTEAQKKLGKLIFGAKEGLEDIQVKNATRIAKLDRQFQENREQLAEGNMSIKDRRKLLADTLLLQDQIAAAKEEEANAELKLIELEKQKYKNAKDVPHDLLLKEAQAQGQLDEIQADAASSKVKLTKQETAMENDELKKRLENAKKYAELRKELDYEIAKSHIEIMLDETQKAIAMSELELQKTIQDNLAKYGNNKRTAELNKALAEKAAQEQLDILVSQLEAEVQAEQDYADKKAEVEQKEFDDFFSQLESERDAEFEAQQKADAFDKSQQELKLKKEQEFMGKSIQQLDNATKAKNEIVQKGYSDEIDASKQRQEDLRALSQKGTTDSLNNLAYEKRQEELIKAKQAKQKKKEKAEEYALAILKDYTAHLDKSPGTALIDTGKDAGILKGLISALPAFLDGTDDTGNVNGGGVDGKKGKLAIIHPNERIMTKDQNRLVGDMTNEQLAQLAWASRMNSAAFSRTADSLKPIEAGQYFELKALNEKMDTLNKTIQDKPEVKETFDEINKMILTEIKTSGRIEKTSRKGGFHG